MRPFLCYLFCLISSAHFLQAESLWEEDLSRYFVKSKRSFLMQFHYFTYLYVAQNDVGSCDDNLMAAIAFELAKYLFPDFIDEREYPESLQQEAKKYLTPYIERLELEKINTHRFPSTCWFEKNPQNVEIISHWIPWSGQLPTTPPPPAAHNYAAWKEQFAQLEEIQNHLTDYEISAIHKWARGKGCCWRALMDEFLEKENVTPEKKALVRALTMKALYDGMIAEYEAKFLYCVPRPGVMDPSFKPLIWANNPSYPSGHAIQGAITATIFSTFFPEFTRYWQNLAEESADSRLWAGVHFPEDIQQGAILGRKVAQQTLLAHPLESANLK